jgi:hypothetical protein
MCQRIQVPLLKGPSIASMQIRNPFFDPFDLLEHFCDFASGLLKRHCAAFHLSQQLTLKCPATIRAIRIDGCIASPLMQSMAATTILRLIDLFDLQSHRLDT